MSLAAYRKEHVPPDDPRQKEVYKEGDLNVSLIRTNQGRVIRLEHNVTSPQPYDRINLIAGTKGIFRDYPPRLYLDGDAKEEFGPLDPYKAKFEHTYWKETGELARKSRAMRDGLRNGLPAGEMHPRWQAARYRRVRRRGMERPRSAQRSLGSQRQRPCKARSLHR